jgi:hypothetical protein
MATPFEVWLATGCRFNAEAAAATVDQGIDSVDEMLEFNSEADVNDLAKALRSPGGEVPIPNAPAGQATTKKDPGVKITHTNVRRFWQFCYAAHMRVNTTRTTTIAELTEDERVRWAEYLKNSKDYKEPKVHPDQKDLSANWPKGFESLRDHFKKLRGDFNKIPLAYITRKEEDVPDETTDPSSNYKSIEDELVARKAHWLLVANQPPRRTEEYKGDNKKVWDVLSDIFRNSPSWQYLKPFAKANDGRGASFGAL